MDIIKTAKEIVQTMYDDMEIPPNLQYMYERKHIVDAVHKINEILIEWEHLRTQPQPIICCKCIKDKIIEQKKP